MLTNFLTYCTAFSIHSNVIKTPYLCLIHNGLVDSRTVFSSVDNTHHSSTKAKVKSTSSVPLQSKKFNKYDNRGDIAHLGSENVVLKGYQPLTEGGSPIRPVRERSGSDPTTEVHLQPLKTQNSVNISN